jgi:hypothetical protein
VEFVLADPAAAPADRCPKVPCAVAYRSSAPLNVGFSPNTTAEFLNWMDRVFHPNIKTVVSVNTMRQLLDGSAPLIFGVDLKEKPKFLPKRQLLHLVSSALFRVFNLTVSEGVYLYRPIDRQLIQLQTADFTSLLLTNLTYFSSSLFQNAKTKIVGFTQDRRNAFLSDIQFAALRSLALEFTNCVFTMVNESHLSFFHNLTRTESVPAPFFFVVDSANPARRRWVLSNADVLECRDLLLRILDDLAPPVLLSEPVPVNQTGSIVQIVGSNFGSEVFNDTREAVVIFTRTDCNRFQFFRPVVEAVAEVLRKSRADFFYIDVAKNDVPAVVPNITQFPTVVMWPRGRKDEPVVYRGNNTFIDVLGFIRGNSGRELTVEKFELEAVKKKLAAVLKKIRFG